MIQHYHCSSLGHCCGTGLVPGLGTSSCQKERKKEGRKDGRKKESKIDYTYTKEEYFRVAYSGTLHIQTFQLQFNFYLFICLFIYLCCLFALSRAAPEAYGGSQARGQIGAVAADLHQSHSYTTYTTAHGNAGSLIH